MSMVFPYAAMRSFEAVARLNGFVKAANELGVTQSSVSQQVRALEEWLGCKLLVRGQRRTIPTEEGEQLADAIREGFDRIERVCTSLRRKDRFGQVLTVYSPPGFAVNWLFPRLIRFDDEHPDIPVSISTQQRTLRAPVGENEVLIHYGPDAVAKSNSLKLMDERLFPVCTADRLAECKGLGSIEELRNTTLLVDEVHNQGGAPPTWEFWAGARGQRLPEGLRRRRFGQSNMAIQAAEMGMGIALGREPLVLDALRAGRLVKPQDQEVRSEYSYWLAIPNDAGEDSRITRFRDWLLQEVEAQWDHAPPIGQRDRAAGRV